MQPVQCSQHFANEQWEHLHRYEHQRQQPDAAFTYDLLNRLASAQDNGHWANTYSYDAWGNLWQKTPGAPAGENMNQTPDTGNHLSSYSYDAAGNMQTDGINSWTYVYDAENRITTAGGTTYTYDADGRRVKKSSGTNYWYGPGGAIMAKSDSSGNWTNYIFFGGQRLARNVSGDIKYYITDHLHSTAMFVDKAGTTAAILDDNDFYPWGGVVPGVGKTTSNNHYKMTGKERDTESGLDYYGARYYGSGMGRFMSPDWAAKPATVPYAEFGDPQSLNLYSYTRNSPIIRVDGDGHDANGMLARPGQAGILGTGDGGSADDRFDVTTTYENTYVDGQLVSSVPVSQTIQQVGSSSLLYSGVPIVGHQSMSLSRKGLEFIKGYEKLRKHVYPDQAGYPTIGYGHKILPGEDFSKGITEEDALALLNRDVQKAVRQVNAGLLVSLSQNQFDALVSLAFNAGGGSVAPTNQMMRAVNGGHVTEENFTAYRYVHVKGEAVVSQGLLNRRQAEYQMFSEGGP